MNQDNNSNFLDSKTIISIGLAGLVWFGWQTYLAKKYPQTNIKPVAEGAPNSVAADTESGVNKDKVVNKSATTSNGTPTAPIETTENKVGTPEKLTTFESKDIKFEISNLGMGLKEYTLLSQTDRTKNPIRLGVSAKSGLFEMGDLGSRNLLNFEVTKKADNIFEGVAFVGKTKIIRTLEVNPETLAIKNNVVIQGADADFRGLTVLIPEKTVPAVGGGFLSPSLEHQELIVLHSDTQERINSSASTEKIEKDFANVSLAAIGSQYFATAILDKSEIIPEVSVVGGEHEVEMSSKLIYKNTAGKDNFELSLITYAGSKSLANLEKIDKNLSKIVDLGFFSQIGRVLLVIMKWFYSVFGNWGLAIIFLTLLVRTIVLPLNITTFKSTKKMQQLQPKIAALRERYKDDAQAMNREMMNVWKENKVNPLGGCLPMLLQLPIFFALYQVLGQSIELYQAPFFGWIHDLSIKDPFYVLPVLMGICMYIQQKITPTTMDPTQAKVMQFLPVLFAFMMISLPAGLTLYIFINTLSGILLQQMFMHDRSTAVTKPVKA